jgi:hypothetical protein
MCKQRSGDRATDEEKYADHEMWGAQNIENLFLIGLHSLQAALLADSLRETESTPRPRA